MIMISNRIWNQDKSKRFVSFNKLPTEGSSYFSSHLRKLTQNTQMAPPPNIEISPTYSSFALLISVKTIGAFLGESTEPLGKLAQFTEDEGNYVDVRV